MSGVDEEKTLAFAILEHLQGSVAGEGVEEALATLSTALGVDLSSGNDMSAYSYKPATLPQIFSKGAEALNLSTVGAEMAALNSDPLFQQYLAKITEKGFFKGLEEGSKAYLDRFLKAAGKFKEKQAQADGTKPSPADQARAESLKGEGNQAILSKDYHKAEQLYSEAIALAPTGVSSHVYYCNRAAARSHLGDHMGAVADAEKATELNPAYSKAYSRLGYAHFYLQHYPEARDAYTRAVELDPSNAANKEYLSKAQAKIAEEEAAGGAEGGRGGGGGGGMEDMFSSMAGAGGGGMPDFSQLAGLMGGLGGGGGGEGGGGGNPLAAMLKNPAMMQMAQSMMQAPGMKERAAQMMSDPNAMAKMSQMMGGIMGGSGGGGGGEGGGGGGGGGMPDLASLMSAFGGGGGGGGGGGEGGGPSSGWDSGEDGEKGGRGESSEQI